MLVGILALNSNAQMKVSDVSFASLSDSLQKHKKPILINVYTDWCTYCKMQHRGIKKSKALNTLLSSEFYYLNLNAEEKETLDFNHKSYRFKPSGTNTGIHELVTELGKGGEVSYPMWFILDSTYQMKYSFSGYLKPEELNKLLLAYLNEYKE